MTKAEIDFIGGKIVLYEVPNSMELDIDTNILTIICGNSTLRVEIPDGDEIIGNTNGKETS